MTLNQSVRRDSVIQFELQHTSNIRKSMCIQHEFWTLFTKYYLDYCWNFNENIQNNRNLVLFTANSVKIIVIITERSEHLRFANGSIKISNDLKIKPHSLNFTRKIRLFIENKAHKQCKVLPIFGESSKTFVIRLIKL